MSLHACLTFLENSHVFRDTTAKKIYFRKHPLPPWPEAEASIRSRPEGAQGVLAYAALSLSFSFSFVSLSSIFDLIVFPGPCGNVPHWSFSIFCSILFSNVFSFVFSYCSSPFLITVLMISHLLGIPFSIIFWLLCWWVVIFWPPPFRAWFLYRFFIDFGDGFPFPFAHATF